MTLSHYEATKEAMKRWKSRNRDKVNELQRKYATSYYERNKDLISARRKQMREQKRAYEMQCEIFRLILL
jgi:primosomal protein N''